MKKGEIRMVDVGGKSPVRRTAVASGEIKMSPATIRAIKANRLIKGDCLSAARIAATMAAKNTPNMIPLCHPLKIDWVNVSFKVNRSSIGISCEVRALDRTGVEMEALSAVSIAALTIYDMCKAIDSNMKISSIRLLSKTKR